MLCNGGGITTDKLSRPWRLCGRWPNARSGIIIRCTSSESELLLQSSRCKKGIPMLSTIPPDPSPFFTCLLYRQIKSFCAENCRSLSPSFLGGQCSLLSLCVVASSKINQVSACCRRLRMVCIQLPQATTYTMLHVSLYTPSRLHLRPFPRHYVCQVMAP